MAAALRLAAKRICGALQRPPQAFLTATKELRAPRTSHGGSTLRRPFSSNMELPPPPRKKLQPHPLNNNNNKAAGPSSTGNGESRSLGEKLFLVGIVATPVMLLLHLGSMIKRWKADERRRRELERHIRRSFEDYDYFISTKEKY